MAEIVKFNERNVSMFGIEETVVGQYNAPAASNAIAATALTGSATYTTGKFQFLGDNLSRDEYTYLQDLFAEVSLDTFQQVLGSLSTTVAGAFPLKAFYRACGGKQTILGSIWNGHPVGTLIMDNVNPEDTTISIDHRLSSIQDTNNQLLRKFLGVRGMVDLTASLGSPPTLKFNLKGNVTQPVAAPILTANYQAQPSSVAATVRKQNIVSTKIYPIILPSSIKSGDGVTPSTTITVVAGGHGLTTGDTVEITACKYNSAATGDDKLYNGDYSVTVVDANTFTYTTSSAPTAALPLGSPVILVKGSKAKIFNFSTLTATNFFGFDLIRYLTSSEEGFGKDAIATDVAIGMVRPQTPFVKATSITKSTTTATVTLPNVHGLQVGDLVTINGATDALYNMTKVAVASVVNKNQFTYTMTGTPSANAVANSSDGNITVFVEKSTYQASDIGTSVTLGTDTGVTLSNADAFALALTFDPDSNVQNFFGVELKFGTGPGKYITYKWNKLQLADVKDGKVANLLSRECTFRNTGRSYIYYE